MSKYCALNPPERSPCIVPSPTAVVWLVNWNLVKTNAPLAWSQAVGAASCSAEAAKSQTFGVAVNSRPEHATRNEVTTTSPREEHRRLKRPPSLLGVTCVRIYL